MIIKRATFTMPMRFSAKVIFYSKIFVSSQKKLHGKGSLTINSFKTQPVQHKKKNMQVSGLCTYMNICPGKKERRTN